MKNIFNLFIVISCLSLNIYNQYSNKNIYTSKKNEAENIEKGFVIMELFTSQGCSSCPPADKILEKYVEENNPNIIPLAFHVDYWNYIGWKDPFSKSVFSDRQRVYNQNLNSSTYTPQLIINGKQQLVGSKESNIKKLVEDELKLTKNSTLSINTVEVANNEIKISYNIDNLKLSRFVNIALVKKKETTSIKRGENSGLTQTNYNIVTDFIVKDSKKSNTEAKFTFSNSYKPEDYFIVIYSQKEIGGEITGFSKAEIDKL